jgi:hypothetical protein
VSLTPRPLSPRRKNPPYSLEGRLGGPQSRSGGHGEAKNLSTRVSNPDPLVVQLVSQLLHRLSYPGSYIGYVLTSTTLCGGMKDELCYGNEESCIVS